MAKIQIKRIIEGKPEFIEEVEVRLWGIDGQPNQVFHIGSGTNYSIRANFLIEIIYRINEVQLFYTRSFIHQYQLPGKRDIKKAIKSFRDGETDILAYGDILPETSIVFERKKYQPVDGEETILKIDESCFYSLVISTDIGAVLSGNSSGERSIDIRLFDVALEDGIKFYSDIANEMLHSLFQRPDPAKIRRGDCEWSFARSLNRRAYGLIAPTYAEDYLNNPRLTKVFDGWMKGLPKGGKVLDMGCGHGSPVIERLLKEGFRVSGLDLSPVMLEVAREKFPMVDFREKASTELDDEAKYDGICSFNSMLYLDPVDLINSIYRAYRALRPKGKLFLFGYDTHPTWRGLPLEARLGQWMWSWSYGLKEARHALVEHGYFNVLKANDVTTLDEKIELLENWRKNRQENYERWLKQLEGQDSSFLKSPDPDEMPDKLGYCYAIIAQKQ